MGKELKRKSPLPLLVPVRLMPCSEFLSATCAFATAAPVGSVTVPVMEAVSWAQAAAHKISMTIKDPIRCSIELNFMVNSFS
jgi:hypothetical protein